MAGALQIGVRIGRTIKDWAAGLAGSLRISGRFSRSTEDWQEH